MIPPPSALDATGCESVVVTLDGVVLRVFLRATTADDADVAAYAVAAQDRDASLSPVPAAVGRWYVEEQEFSEDWVDRSLRMRCRELTKALSDALALNGSPLGPRPAPPSPFETLEVGTCSEPHERLRVTREVRVPATRADEWRAMHRHRGEPWIYRLTNEGGPDHTGFLHCMRCGERAVLVD